MVYLAHRVELDPTTVQRVHFVRAAGVARFTYNWALERWNARYTKGERPTAGALLRELTDWKAANAPWVNEVGQHVSKYSILALGTAFRRYVTKVSHLPTFKRMGEHDSFRADNGEGVDLSATHLTVPKLGPVRLKEPPRWPEARIVQVVISREADRWFASVTRDLGNGYSREPSEMRRPVMGIDLGVKTALVCSDGQKFDAPKPLKQKLRLLRIRQRRASRKVKQSANRRKASMRVAKVHRKVKNIRKDWTHKVTTKLARENQTIKLEDLNIKGMMSNHHLARAIADVGFYEIRRQLEYKVPLYGGKVEFVPQFYPSSKTCSSCGWHNRDLKLADRAFICPNCGMVKDRDENAAENIEKYHVPGPTGKLTPARSRKARHDQSSGCRKTAGAGQRRNHTVPTYDVTSDKGYQCGTP